MDNNKAKLIISNCTKQLKGNNTKISNLAKQNSRLLDSMLAAYQFLDSNKNDRINKELKSDNWKKYSVKHGGFRNKTAHRLERKKSERPKCICAEMTQKGVDSWHCFGCNTTWE